MSADYDQTRTESTESVLLGYGHLDIGKLPTSIKGMSAETIKLTYWEKDDRYNNHYETFDQFISSAEQNKLIQNIQDYLNNKISGNVTTLLSRNGSKESKSIYIRIIPVSKFLWHKNYMLGMDNLTVVLTKRELNKFLNQLLVKLSRLS